MKKTLTVLFTAILLCLTFALFVNAEETELRQTVSYNGQEISITRFNSFTVEELATSLNNKSLITKQSKILDENSVVILQDSEGNLSAYPSYYAFELSGQGGDSYVAVSEINYSFINKMLGETRFPSRKAAIVYVEFPHGLTSLRGNSVFGSQNGIGYESLLKEMHVPNTVVTIESNSFKNSSVEKVYFEEGNTISAIVGGAFTNSTKLSFFEFDKLKNLKTINGLSNTKLKVVNLLNCPLEEVQQGAFDSTPIEELFLPDTVKKIDNTAFCKSRITSFKFPKNLEYFGDNVFSGATRFTLESGILPKNLTHIGSYFLANTILPELIVFPSGITKLPNEAFGKAYTQSPDGKTGDLVLVFLGKMTYFDPDGNDYRTWANSVTVYFAQNTLSEVNANVYSFTDKVSGALGSSVSQSGTLTLDVSNSAPNSTSAVSSQFIQLIFCGNYGSVEQSYIIKNDGSAITEDRGLFDMSAHTCYAFSNNENDCTADKICIVCDINKANASHSFIETVVFPDLISKGTKSQSCTNEGCLVSVDGIELDPIIVCLGYSVSEFGVPSIIQGFIVNEASLYEYTSVGNSFEYGLIAGVLSLATNSPLEYKDGNVALKENTKAVVVPSSLIKASVFQIKITNLAEEHFNTELILCMYIVNNGAIEYVSSGIQSAIAPSTTLSANAE